MNQCKFTYLISIHPLGMLYGSSGAFLSAENLVGLSGAKFPPDSAAVSGLILSVNLAKNQNLSAQDQRNKQKELSECLYVAGPFWAKDNDDYEIEYDNFYVPIPRTKIIGRDDWDEWIIEKPDPDNSITWQKKRSKEDLESEKHWFPIFCWDKKTSTIQQNAQDVPWQFNPFLHPKLQEDQKCSVGDDGLFLENAVQMEEGTCLIYLSSHPIEAGWYKFGGENHLVEIKSHLIQENWPIYKLLHQNIQRTFALITPAVWGTKRLSYRIPEAFKHYQVQLMLTDKAIPSRFSVGSWQDKDDKGANLTEPKNRGSRLGRGHYAVPAGSVYVLKEPINKSWSQWCESWFPKSGFSLKHLGNGLCLPLNIKGDD